MQHRAQWSPKHQMQQKNNHSTSDNTHPYLNLMCKYCPKKRKNMSQLSMLLFCKKDPQIIINRFMNETIPFWEIQY